ncbi:hypothetical protein CRG98_008056 [Punica granatum]|uniref:Uncharacterized protein n=1 Tax=Punica granatum TaxID=22663 RepID=A0A2I0KSU3_PUNGR|nr:hypothetical protein CRG98_008056 [Punica granatum]
MVVGWRVGDSWGGGVGGSRGVRGDAGGGSSFARGTPAEWGARGGKGTLIKEGDLDDPTKLLVQLWEASPFRSVFIEK